MDPPTQPQPAARQSSNSHTRPILTPQQSMVMPHGTPSPTRRIVDKRTIEQQQQMQNEVSEGLRQEKMPRTSRLPKYSTVGQFSYAPATQTTVVTTTTTTTTHFPLLQLQPPRHLNELDPKKYPLATQPTPTNLKRFCFDIDGKPTYFREAEDPDVAVEDMDTLIENLRRGGGVIRDVKQNDEVADVPEQFMKTPTSATAPEMCGDLGTGSASRKRPASPVSLSEAAERVATMQKGSSKRRHTGKTRPSILHSLNTTSPLVRKGAKGKGAAASSSAAPFADAESPTNARSAQWSGPGLLSQPSSHIRSLFSPGRVNSSQQQETPITQSPQLTPATQDRAVDELALVAVPDAENAMAVDSIGGVGMDAVDTPTSENMAITVDTSTRELSVEQTLSLPSPSLSPVTAALTHGNSGFFSPSADDDINSPFDLGPSGSDHREHGMQLVRSPRSNHYENIGYRSLQDIPNMIDSFDTMPTQLQSYVLFNLLRRSQKSTLQMVASVVNPALKCDFISNLPVELSLGILQYLDYKSLCNSAQVSKKWRVIVDSDEWTWKKRFEEDGYSLAEGELERAVNEGWGFQIPRKNKDYERDIRVVLRESSVTAAAAISPAKVQKRKTRAMAKQQKKKQETVERLGKEEFNELIAELSNNDWPSTALGQSPQFNDVLGLPQLRIHHLYKSIYRRHHLIRQSWIKPDMEPRHISFRGHQRHVVTCLQFDTDKILTGSDDNNINVYDTNTGALRKTLMGHEGGVWALQYEGNTLVSGSTDRTVRVWDIATGNCTQIFHGHTSTVRCLQILMPAKVGVGLNGRDKMMPKQPLIITGSRDSTLRIWKLPQAGDRPYLPEAGGDGSNLSNNPFFVRTLTGHTQSVRAIAAHGDTLVSGSYDYTVRVWRISTGETVHRLAGHTQKVYSVVLDTKRNRCISGSMDNLVRVWSLETGSLIFTLEGHSSLVGLLDLSHDHLVSAAADHTLRIWDPESGQCKHVLSAHTGAITCFQHDGNKVISGSDGTLKMWNVQTGAFVRDLLTDLSGVWQVKFNERRCVAAVQRESITYIEVLDFGAARDGIMPSERGRRVVVDHNGIEIPTQTAAVLEPVEA